MFSVTGFFRSTMVAFVCLLGALHAVPSNAQPGPMAPEVVEILRFGKMQGEHLLYGMAVGALGDVSGDSLADWVVEQYRNDTTIAGLTPTELLLYNGQRSGLPDVRSGIRIGPEEIGTSTRFLAAGDFDADTHRDIVVAVSVLGDTSEGNTGYRLWRVCVLWGSASGMFSLLNAAQLGNPHEIWMAAGEAAAVDFDHDGVDDLAIWGGWTLSAAAQEPTPVLHIFCGARRRWGQAAPQVPEWQWWTPPKHNMLRAIDQDGDGAIDLALINNDGGNGLSNVTWLSVLYGRRGALPDTNDLETLVTATDSVNQMYFMDLTGDRLPELVTTSYPRQVAEVFVGLRGQRLLQQYGSGRDAPRPGDSAWWGRPWAQIWLPSRIDSNWYHIGAGMLYDLGDVGLDGSCDLCLAYVYNTVLCYNGGGVLDSLVDSWMGLPGWGPGEIDAVAVLGDIDGSGLPTIAFGASSASVVFFKPTRSVPGWGVPRRLPPGTDRPAGRVVPQSNRNDDLTVWLNGGWLHARWSQPGASHVTIASINGQIVNEWRLDAGTRRLDADLAGLPSGTWVLLVQSAGHTIKRLVTAVR